MTHRNDVNILIVSCDYENDVIAGLARSAFPDVACAQRTTHASHVWAPFPVSIDERGARPEMRAADRLEFSFCIGVRPRTLGEHQRTSSAALRKMAKGTIRP